VLGLCCLLESPPELRPASLMEHATKVMPSLIMLFQGLQRAYAQKAALENEEDDGSDEEDEDYEARE
jgi:hypothetical protein